MKNKMIRSCILTFLLVLVNPPFSRSSDLAVTGNLSVTGTSQFEGNLLDFGTTGTSYSALALEYLESGGDYTFSLSATRAGAIYLWQDNAGGTAKPKMKLDGNNSLFLYASDYNPSSPDVGKISLNPSTSGSEITIDGTPLVTGTMIEDFITETDGDDRYAFSSTITASEFYSEIMSSSGPAIALSGGSATAAYSFAGVWATASSDLATASASFSSATGFASTASAAGSWADGDYATASATQAHAIGEYSVATGYAAEAGGGFSVASGACSNASGSMSVASNYFSNASGTGAHASGFRSFAAGNFSTASGAFTTADAYAQYVVGLYNQGATDALFIVGNGSGDELGNPTYLSNAFVIKYNGDTSINGALNVSGSANFSGRIRVAPQGDLSMGEYTAEPTP